MCVEPQDPHTTMAACQQPPPTHSSGPAWDVVDTEAGVALAGQGRWSLAAAGWHHPQSPSTKVGCLPLYPKQQPSAVLLNMHGDHLATVPEDRVH